MNNLEWPFNLMADLNKESDPADEKFPINKNEAPRDIQAVVMYILTNIQYSCRTKCRQRGAVSILFRYRDDTPVKEIASRFGVSTACIYADINVVLEVMRKAVLYRALLIRGLDGYIKDERVASEQRGCHLGYAEGVLNAKKDEQVVDDTLIEDCHFSVRTHNCLIRSGITTIGQLKGKNVEDLLSIRNLGRKSADEIVSFIKNLDAYEGGV